MYGSEGREMAASSPYPTKGREKNRMKKVPSQAKGIGTFSFWDGFEAGISINRQPSRSPPAFSHWGALVERKKAKGYSICVSSGWSARTSASLANLRGCLGSSAIRVRSCPMPKRIR